MTRVYYVCGTLDCHKTKIEQIEGHWTLEELQAYDGTV
jgi:hypothetical protein